MQAIVGQDTTSIVKSCKSIEQGKYSSLLSSAEIKLIRKDQVVMILCSICQVTYCKSASVRTEKNKSYHPFQQPPPCFCSFLRASRNVQSSDIGTSVSIVEAGIAFES